MMVTLAFLLPRTGRPVRSILLTGSELMSVLSKRASVFPSLEIRKSIVVLRVLLSSVTGRVSKPGKSLGLRAPMLISTLGGTLNWLRIWLAIRRSAGEVGAEVGAGAWAEHPTARSITNSELRSQPGENKV